MHLFPESGFDQSATTPVFLGVLVSWFFTESFGWVFAGLVVPGYLATLFLLDPRSAMIDVGEAVLTYGIARLLGEHLSWTGLSSRMFGRERFLLVLIVSVLVRLGLEGVVFAHFLPHATWAYSIGLVVVPLAANACWKTGLLRGALQAGVPTAIVYGLLRYLLVPYTNLSLAGFQLATENIAASFLASPKAYVLLLTGAVLGAVANVRYGWDYNGILLPALLALVVAHPTKLAATLAEVLLLVGVTRALLLVPPVRHWNIEGPRRTVLFFSIDYALRFAFAALVGRSLPGTDLIEVTGFGYLLPTLLAVKISQRNLASLVLLPTVCVAAFAFALGSLLGFVAERLDADSLGVSEPVARTAARAPNDPVLAALWLSALARPAPTRAAAGASLSPAILTRLADALLAGARPRVPAQVEVQRLVGGVVLLRERFEDPEHRLGAPALLLAPRGRSPLRVVAWVPTPLAAPETAALAGHLLATRAVDAVVLAGADEPPQRMASSWSTARALADRAGSTRRGGIVAMLQQSASGTWRARLSERAAREPRVLALLEAAENPPHDVDPGLDALRAGQDLSIEVPAAVAVPWLTAGSGGLSLATSTALASSLDRVTASHQRLAFEDLIALRRLVLEPLLGASTATSALPLIRASARALGYELLGPAKLPDGDQAVVLRPGASAPALALLVRLEKASGLVIEAPFGARAAVNGLALRCLDWLRADAVLVGLDSEKGALGNAAFAEAHAAATWPTRQRSSSVVVVRAAAIDGAQAQIGSWGGDAAGSLAERSAAALAALGIPTLLAPLDLATREQAARSVFGQTPLVAITLDPSMLRKGALAWPPDALAAFATLRVIDADCDRVAIELAASLQTGIDAAPAGILGVARRAALEHSIVAQRALEDALRTSASKAAVARASTGVFLVVVGRAPHALVAGAFPLALAPPGDEAPLLAAQSLEACRETLTRGGTCSVAEATP